MKILLLLLAQLLTAVARHLGPGGANAVIAENLLLKQQLLVISHAWRRAPNLTTLDRLLFSLWSLFINPRRLSKVAVTIKPSTLLKCHETLKKRKYRLLFSPRRKGKPGPKGPSPEIIQVIVEMKRKNSGISTTVIVYMRRSVAIHHRKSAGKLSSIELIYNTECQETPFKRHPGFR